MASSSSASIPAHPYRVYVSGLCKGPVTAYTGQLPGIEEEDALGYFFQNRGCQVEDVRLMVDPNSSKCRGFGFVDFQDEASLQEALTLAGTRDVGKVKLDPSAKGVLKIEEAKRPEADNATKKKLLAQACAKNEELERAVRHKEAQVQDLQRQKNMQLRKQHQLVSEMLESEKLDKQLEEEAKRSQELKELEERLKMAQEQLEQDVKTHQERTSAIEAIVVNVDRKHMRPHIADDEEEDLQRTDRVPPTTEQESDLRVLFDMSNVSVKNTFFEVTVPKEVAPLMRTQTAPPTYAEVSRASSDGTSPAPWTLKRDASHNNPPIMRAILEEKMDAEAGLPRGQSLEKVVSKGSPLLAPSSAAIGDAARTGVRPAWADVKSSEGDGNSVEGGGEAEDKVMEEKDTGRREVRIRNLPNEPTDELEVGLVDELIRVWKVALKRPLGPTIDEIEIPPKEESWASRAAGKEAYVTFKYSEDATWLVERREPPTWSHAEALTLRGRPLQVDWKPVPQPSPPADMRRWAYKADTDASSQISYATDGTKRSFSSAVARGAAATNAAMPPMNRTVILDGIDKSTPTHTVRSEVLEMLKRLWRPNVFNIKAQLHREMDGIVVNASRKRGEENDGRCTVKFRNYLDAKWLVEQAPSRALTIEGKPLRASWARPRGNPSGVASGFQGPPGPVPAGQTPSRP